MPRQALRLGLVSAVVAGGELATRKSNRLADILAGTGPRRMARGQAR